MCIDQTFPAPDTRYYYQYQVTNSPILFALYTSLTLVTDHSTSICCPLIVLYFEHCFTGHTQLARMASRVDVIRRHLDPEDRDDSRKQLVSDTLKHGKVIHRVTRHGVFHLPVDMLTVVYKQAPIS